MESVRDYELRAFFSYVVSVLERLQISYMVVGGFAAIFHGEPRLTLGVDIVVDMKNTHIRSLVAAFPIAEYYLSEEAIRDSLESKHAFNIIQPGTGAKIDLVPLPRDLFTQAAFKRRRWLSFDEHGHTAAFITTEDIVIAKLVAFRETQSDKHLRDARGVLVTQWGKLDLESVRRGATSVHMAETLEQIIKEAELELSDNL